MVKTPLSLALALLVTACGAGAQTTAEPLPQTTVLKVTSTTALVSDAACPVTIPPQPALIPPEPYPPQAPDLYQSVWYGTSALWTMLDPEGEVWGGIPQVHGGMIGAKTIWWSDLYHGTMERPITVTGRQLDGAATFEAVGPGGGGFREDIGSFMMVGLEIPAPGCWEVTTKYGDAELSYVVKVGR